MNAPQTGTRVPAQEVELYLALGWRLKDEPSCGLVLMLPPEHREVAR